MPSSRFLWATVNATSANIPAAAARGDRPNGTYERDHFALSLEETVPAVAHQRNRDSSFVGRRGGAGIMRTNGLDRPVCGGSGRSVPRRTLDGHVGLDRISLGEKIRAAVLDHPDRASTPVSFQFAHRVLIRPDGACGRFADNNDILSPGKNVRPRTTGKFITVKYEDATAFR